ncbi:carbohydrate-binding module family 63 protein [Xylariaceae sp. FL1272]|nr:carbohydrate-binding module family 63 protein [Xylariaceae sp. FL1272]
MKTIAAVLSLAAVPMVLACPTRSKVTTVLSMSAASATTSVSIPAANAATDVAISAASDSTAVTGTSTFYGGNLNGGTCSFSTYTLPSGIYGTAYSGSSWDSAANCGACIEVTANGKSIVAMIVDQCPECDAGHLDLFEDAFDVLSPSSSDPLATSYTFVDCGITSPLVLHNKSGTSAYWFSMQVVNSNEPVAKLEVSIDGGKTWSATTRQDYNFFENSSGFGTSTVDVRLTSGSGSTMTVSSVSVASDSQVTASSNF